MLEKLPEKYEEEPLDAKYDDDDIYAPLEFEFDANGLIDNDLDLSDFEQESDPEHDFDVDDDNDDDNNDGRVNNAYIAMMALVDPEAVVVVPTSSNLRAWQVLNNADMDQAEVERMQQQNMDEDEVAMAELLMMIENDDD